MNGKSRTFAIPITKKRGERQYKDWEFFESLKASIRKSWRFCREAGAPVRKRDGVDSPSSAYRKKKAISCARHHRC